MTGPPVNVIAWYAFARKKSQGGGSIPPGVKMSSDDDESRVVDASLETVEWSAVHSWVAELHDDAINHIYASRLALQRMLDDGCADLRSIDAAIDQLDRAVEALQSAGMLLATDPYGLADASGPLAT